MAKLKTVVVTGCSSIGKTTLAKLLLAKFPALSIVNSYTTREKRAEDINYIHISVPEFEHLVISNQFADYNEVYKGTYYGTKWESLQNITKIGKMPLLVTDNVGAENYFDITDCLLINLIPTDLEVIRKRIVAGRSKRIEERLATMQHGSLGFGNDFYIKNTFDEVLDDILLITENWLNDNTK